MTSTNARPYTAGEAEITLVTVVRAGDQLLKACDEFFRPYDLTDAQYNVLRILEGAGEALPQRELANRLMVSRASITSLIDKLEARGFVQRCECADRRMKLIELTTSGQAFLKETFEAVQQLCVARMQALSRPEQHELHRLLTKLIDGAR